MDQSEIKFFIEAALLAAGRPLNAGQLRDLFDGRSAPDKGEIRQAIAALVEEYEPRGITIAEVASGFRIQVKAAMADRLKKLWEERPPRYSRALFETLALVAYRQPITRGEIEEVRGVSVSSNIIRTLMERDWVRIVGHRDVPGRPAMFGTTRAFLDYFGLRKLDDLPPLADLADWESLRVQLNLPEVEDTDAVSVPPADALEPAAANDGEAESDVEALADEGEDLPVLPVGIEDAAEAADVGAEATDSEPVSGDAVEDPGDDIEELVVSEWPDPGDAKAITTLETHKDDDDRDASAGGS